MSATSFTPGPWLNVEPDATAPSRARVCALAGADIYDAPLTDETASNAALIAAAPDLYEALRALIRVMTTPPTERGFKDDADLLASASDLSDPRWAEEDDAIAKARGALAKADGR